MTSRNRREVRSRQWVRSTIVAATPIHRKRQIGSCRRTYECQRMTEEKRSLDRPTTDMQDASNIYHSTKEEGRCELHNVDVMSPTGSPICAFVQPETGNDRRREPTAKTRLMWRAHAGVRMSRVTNTSSLKCQTLAATGGLTSSPRSSKSARTTGG